MTNEEARFLCDWIEGHPAGIPQWSSLCTTLNTISPTHTFTVEQLPYGNDDKGIHVVGTECHTGQRMIGAWYDGVKDDTRVGAFPQEFVPRAIPPSSSIMGMGTDHDL